MKTIAYTLAIFIFAGMLIFVQCHTKPKKTSYNSGNTISKNDLIGTWKNLSMTITYFENDSVFNVPEGKWEEILNIKPILTNYLADQTYRSDYYALNDSLLFSSRGTWRLIGDSLYLTTESITTAYRFSKDGKVGTFTGMLDWNEDGKVNELYHGRQVKME